MGRCVCLEDVRQMGHFSHRANKKKEDDISIYNVCLSFALLLQIARLLSTDRCCQDQVRPSTNVPGGLGSWVPRDVCVVRSGYANGR